MSKKSRKRNKKILAAIGLGLGAAALASRKPKQSDVSQDSGRGSGLRDTVDTAKKDTAVKPIAKPVKRRGTVLGKPGINKMDTSEVDLDYTAPSTTKYKNMNMGLEGFAAKDGGRAMKKSGGKAIKKSMGKALRGGGRVMR